MNQRSIPQAQSVSVEPEVTSAALRAVKAQDPNRGGRPVVVRPLPKYMKVLHPRYHKELDIERVQDLEDTRFMWANPGIDSKEFEYLGYEPRPWGYPVMRTSIHNRVL